MKISQYITLIITILMLSIGQIFFKTASGKINIQSGFIQSILFNVPLITGLFIYCLATILWVYILREVPLSIAYPFAALSYIFVPFLAFYFLDEKLDYTSMLGALFIIVGVFISTL